MHGLLLIHRPRKDGRLSGPCWLTWRRTLCPPQSLAQEREGRCAVNAGHWRWPPNHRGPWLACSASLRCPRSQESPIGERIQSTGCGTGLIFVAPIANWRWRRSAVCFVRSVVWTANHFTRFHWWRRVAITSTSLSSSSLSSSLSLRKIGKAPVTTFMYKTAVYTTVNGGITNQKQQISKKCDITQHYSARVSTYCWAISCTSCLGQFGMGTTIWHVW